MLPIILVAAALASLAYVLAVYPALVWWMSRRFERPVLRGSESKTVSVIIAVHNGARFLAEKLDSIRALEYPAELLEVIVVSDGSTDQTEAIASSYAGVTLVTQPRGGKCAAINEGVRRSKHEILLLTDVRQRVAPASLRYLISCFADPSVGAVSGDLVILEGDRQDEADVGLYWRYESMMRRALSRLDSMFGATGPFYALRRDLAVPIPPGVLLDDMYLPLAAFFRGKRLIVEERAKAYDYPTSVATEFHRKVRTLAGNWQLLRYYPALLGPGNRMWFHFVSYKIGRLLLPYMLLTIAIASFGLPSPARELLLAAQAILYLLAAVDPWIPRHMPGKRVSSLLRTFVSMMVATLASLRILFTSPQTLWKVTEQIGPAKSRPPRG
jgi:poly-beta-1,6-N-acetyl-D-glucosamine synthase